MINIEKHTFIKFEAIGVHIIVLILILAFLTAGCKGAVVSSEVNVSQQLILENVMFGTAPEKSLMLGLRNPGNSAITVDSIYIRDVRYSNNISIIGRSLHEMKLPYNWTKGEQFSIIAVTTTGFADELVTTAPDNITKIPSMGRSTSSSNQGYLPKDALLVLVIVTMLMLFLGSWWSSTKVQNKSSWYDNPLGLPKGSIRAIIALLFVMTILISARDSASLPEWLAGIVGTIIGFYFGDRTSEKG